MTENKIKKYHTLEELINDVEALGDWKDPAQQEAFSEVYFKMANTGNECHINGKLTYYPIDVYSAMKDVSSQKFPTPEGDLEIEASMFYSHIHNLAIKNHGPLIFSRIGPETIEQAEYDQLVDSCKKYLNEKYPPVPDVVIELQ